MNARTVCAVGLVATLVVFVASLAIGPGEVGLGQAVDIVIARGTGDDRIASALVWDIRVPRGLLVVLVGASLSAAGVVTQGLFRNPMAEPGVLGVAAGAATAAVVGFTLGLDRLGPWVTPLLSGLGAATILAVLFALARPATGLTTLLLSGIALGALCSAVTTLMLAVGTERWDLGVKVVRWLMGSFEARGFEHLGWSVVPIVLGLGACVWLRLPLDALQLGPETAESLGVDLQRTRTVAVVAIAILVGVATAVAGVIGFVGLVVPHVARLLVGAGHRALLPTATILGGGILLVVDVASRSAPDLVMPPGAITALLGAPFFLWLLRRYLGEGL